MYLFAHKQFFVTLVVFLLLLGGIFFMAVGGPRGKTLADYQAKRTRHTQFVVNVSGVFGKARVDVRGDKAMLLVDVAKQQRVFLEKKSNNITIVQEGGKVASRLEVQQGVYAQPTDVWAILSGYDGFDMTATPQKTVWRNQRLADVFRLEDANHTKLRLTVDRASGMPVLLEVLGEGDVVQRSVTFTYTFAPVAADTVVPPKGLQMNEIIVPKSH